jgi:hypothetical protein
MSLLLYPTTDTIPLLASTRNAKSNWTMMAAVLELEEEIAPAREEVHRNATRAHPEEVRRKTQRACVAEAGWRIQGAQARSLLSSFDQAFAADAN